MKTVRMTVDPAALTSLVAGRIDPARVDATSNTEIDAQQAADEGDALHMQPNSSVGSENAWA